jgi:hypothetical protein
LPTNVTVSNSQHPIRDQPDSDTHDQRRIPASTYSHVEDDDIPEDSDDLSATSDEMPAQCTTEFYSNDSDNSDDSKASEIVNKSDIFSI